MAPTALTPVCVGGGAGARGPGRHAPAAARPRPQPGPLPPVLPRPLRPLRPAHLSLGAVLPQPARPVVPALHNMISVDISFSEQKVERKENLTNRQFI